MSGEKIEQNWDVKVNIDNPVFPFLVVDNWYLPEEEKAIWKELDFISCAPRNYHKKDENTIVATDKDGNAKSNAFRFYLSSYYTDEVISPIMNGLYKQKSPEFHKIIGQITPQGRAFLSSTGDSTMVSYYENKQHYKPHHDTFMWTCLIWMVREPRKFTGGDFILNEPEVEIKLRNNRMVMFPCNYLHEVTPVFMKEQPKEMGWGRWTITHFYFSNPNQNSNDDRPRNVLEVNNENK